MTLSRNPASTIIYGTPPPGIEDLVRLFDPDDFAIAREPLHGALPPPPEGTALCIIESTREQVPIVQSILRRWQMMLGSRFVPVLWVLPEHCQDLVPEALNAGVEISLARPFDLVTFMAQCRALVRLSMQFNRIAARAAEAQSINQRLQQAYQQIDNDLELTRRIHRGFLPRSLPDVLQTRFAVCYRPRSRMGGDFYDVIRLDEEHVALFVADAMGRGVPASSLLGIYVKKCLTPKEIVGRSYRLIPPDEVLQRLNRELVALGLPEPPFVTMTFMQLNCRDGNLVYARAGHPFPLHIPRDGPIRYWHATGPFLGVFDASFPAFKGQLQAGDKLLLCSDGVQQLEESGKPMQPDRLLESAYRNRGLAAQPFVDTLARDLLESSRNADDFTLLALEFVGHR